MIGRRHFLAAVLVGSFVFPQTSKITVHLAGDSTMAEKLASKRPETGWGEMLAPYLDTSSVRVMNHARNGRSTRTFISEGLWQQLLDSLRPGDYVFIQFGHNDESKDKTDRYTPPADYKANLTRFVSETRAKGAIPVLMTPVARRRFHTKGDFYDTHGEYPDLVREVAKRDRVALVDMNRSSGDALRLFGPEASSALFLQLAPGENSNYPNGIKDNTHFSPFGARVMAALAVEGIRAAGLDLAKHLRVIPAPNVPAVRDSSGKLVPRLQARISGGRSKFDELCSHQALLRLEIVAVSAAPGAPRHLVEPDFALTEPRPPMQKNQ